MADRWTKAKVPDMNGAVVIITGANSGIGLEAAKTLAMHNARVILAVRNESKGQRAKDAILQASPPAHVEIMQLDLADLSSIRNFAEAFLARQEPLQLLINNAGVMGPSYGKTKDGFEMQFGTNHLGHFALTGLLLHGLRQATGARVVTVSSAAHTAGHIHFDNLDGRAGYRRWGFYGQSKLANLLFAYEFQRRLTMANVDIKSVACHPGFAATNLTANGFGARVPIAGKALGFTANLFAQSAQMGTLPTLYAATEPSIHGGEYIGPLGGMRGYPGIVRSNARSHDEAVAQQLWNVSEQLTGVHYSIS